MKLEITDENVLKLSGIANAAYGAALWAAPKESHDLWATEKVPESAPLMRMWGLSSAATGAQTLAVGLSDNRTPELQRNVLRANGWVWAAVAGQHAWNLSDDFQKKEVHLGYANLAVAATLSALCLWRGYREEDDAKAA